MSALMLFAEPVTLDECPLRHAPRESSEVSFNYSNYSADDSSIIAEPESRIDRTPVQERCSDVVTVTSERLMLEENSAIVRPTFEEHQRDYGITHRSEHSWRLPNVSASPERRLVSGTQRTRKGLPLLFELGYGYHEVMTGHDTGTEANHMSLALAEELGYTIETVPADTLQFQLPNGKIIGAIGRVTAQVQFAQGQDSKSSTFTCYFNVFSKLALPALIGMSFLNATKTLTTHTSRLAVLPTGWKRSLRLCAVGNATNQVTCVLDGREVKATADTGAEIALVSGEYALQHGILREFSCEELELADGSKEYTSGFGDIELAIRLPAQTSFAKLRDRWTTQTVRFHVLKNLHFDVLLDEDIVENFGIFRHSLGTILTSVTGAAQSLGPIAHLRTIERSLVDTKIKVTNFWNSLILPTNADRSTETEQSSPNSTLTQSEQQDPMLIEIYGDHPEKNKIRKRLMELDRHERQRRNGLRREAKSRKNPSFTLAEARQNETMLTTYTNARKVLNDELRALA